MSCVGSERALGGGGLAPTGADNSRMNSNSPVLTGANPTGWRVEWHGSGGGAADAGTYTVYAICAV